VKEDADWPVWGEAAGILVGGPSLNRPAPDGKSRYFGAIDSRAAAGARSGIDLPRRKACERHVRSGERVPKGP
jgi:hypothetical protein